MTAYAYFNIKEEKDKYVYRIVSFDIFKSILVNRKFGFVNPTKWDDPYENFLLNQEYETKDGQKLSFKELTKSLYGSCWTFNSNSDYAWRVYSRDKDGVQIKVRISDLYEGFSHLKNDPNLATFHLGKINYVKWRKLKEQYEKNRNLNLFLLSNNYQSFQKRFEYRHEKEVRILLRYHEHSDDLLFVDIDINKVSNSIMLDPRYNFSDFQKKKQELKSLGFQGRIYRSTLYTPPRLNLSYENVLG